MSLDVYLSVPRVLDDEEVERLAASDRLRDLGMTHAAAFLVSSVGDLDDDVFWKNITHNLGGMAEAAGIYQHLWRPEELGITEAKQLIQLLFDAWVQLTAHPDRFRPHNPPNGWGSYEGFVRFVENYLEACRKYPDAKVSVSR